MRYATTLALALAATFSAAGAAVQAQEAPYPAKPVTILVGFPPGTATDTVARMLGERLAQRMGQQFIVENKPGAGGSIAAGLGARARPDGYTLMIGASAPQAINPHVYPNLNYDARKDFAPIGLITWLPYLFVVSPDNPARNLTEFLAAVKAKPGQYTYATTGIGTTSHLVTAVLLSKAGAAMVHVPYKGSSQAQTDIVGGRTYATFDTMVSSLAMVKAGRLKALAVSTTERVSTLPDVPTVAEQGFAGFDMGAWLGLIAPAGIPPAIQDRLAREMNAVLADPAVRDKLADIGAQVRTTASPASFGAMMKSEYDSWGKVVREFNVKATD
ncbi:Bug family tripartite tricarboxylate transporter substrate binding protein [Achromobacter deleyi]|uniref:Bug family tripartite tricarboxylate transporter substrate binding protein n=1 Tax=Achromobacter deleyi TaxID=1353891 RepID=UPI001491E1BD|nr:tripartite tricarboxylate transporter substrate binding protein [Achromobacter deleyi]QVQ28357.1 tripartite tricarboxylate transporter substrate binding protein [Achromobacter deleyi]UIP18458.1 tripartite tricarboxylate transporter substrate binding protein [Achromobacter deleyi]